jgi:hypothetical protein
MVALYTTKYYSRSLLWITTLSWRLRLLCVRNNQQIVWCDMINGLYEVVLSVETNSKDIDRK